MAETLNVDPVAPQPERIARAVSLIRAGGVVAIPTDTVYGLAANPFDASAVEKLFAVKGRATSAPILLLVESVEMAATLAENLPPLFRPLAQRFWPGPLTIVIDAAKEIPPVVTAHTGRVGLRWPDAAIACALIRAVGGPITATSANVSGQPECRSAQEVAAVLGKHIALILDGGRSGAARTSTVIGLSGNSWNVIREGALPRAELEKVLGGGQKKTGG